MCSRLLLQRHDVQKPVSELIRSAWSTDQQTFSENQLKDFSFPELKIRNRTFLRYDASSFPYYMYKTLDEFFKEDVHRMSSNAGEAKVVTRKKKNTDVQFCLGH
jgi:hypothetical protein